MASLKELVDLYGPLGLKENKSRVNPLEIMPPEASIPSPQAPLENRNLAADAALSKVPVSQPEIKPAQTETPMEQMIRAQNEYKRQKLALLDPIIKRQEAAAEMQRNALDSYLRNTSAKLDISPLAALVDAQTGSKFSQSYKAPSNASDLSDKILKGEGAVGDSEQGIAATQLKAMGDQLGGKLAEAQLRQSATQGRSDRAYDLQIKDKLFKGFQGDKIATAAKEALKGAADAKALLDSNTPVGDRGFTVALARASGEKGPLSETDIATWSGSPAIAQRISRSIEKFNTGRLDEIDKKDMYHIIDVLQKRQAAQLNDRVNYFSKQVAPKVYGIDTDSAMAMLSDESTAPLAAQAFNLAPQAVGVPSPKNTFVGKDGNTYEDLGNGKARRIK